MPNPRSGTIHHDGTPIGSSAAAPAATSAITMAMPDFWAMQQYNNEWSAAQAQADRDWQERLANTAHQREVADLQAAGLNPVLSAGGSGASTPSGAMAATDNSASSAMASVMNALIGAQSAQAVANKYTAMEKYVAELNDATKRNYPSSLWGVISTVVNGLSDNGMLGAVRFAKGTVANGWDVLRSFIKQLDRAGHRSGRF